MPAVLVQRDEQMWRALKAHIMRERQRRKQEQEADAEEERLRKERERQQKQDVMTLGETREQISNLENELAQLKDEKHQLFLRLKRVLNEDDRRRQFVKETNACSEIFVGGYPTAGPKVAHPQLFLPIERSTSPIYKPVVAGAAHLLPSGSFKRSHSPSPPPAVPSYHPTYYKPSPSIPTYSTPPPKQEEVSRRSSDSRAVLWNKNSQYSFYPAPTGQGVYSYPAPASQPSRETSEPAKPVYLSGGRTPLATQTNTYVTNLHSMEQHKSYGEEKFYLRPTGHLTVHGGAIPIQQPPQAAKTGGITSGYPIRAPQPPPGPYPPPPPPPVTYVSASGVNLPSRLYTHPNTRYLQRDV